MSAGPREPFELTDVRERAGLGRDNRIGNVLDRCVDVDAIIVGDIQAITAQVREGSAVIADVRRALNATWPESPGSRFEGVITVGRLVAVALALAAGAIAGGALSHAGRICEGADVPTAASLETAPPAETDGKEGGPKP